MDSGFRQTALPSVAVKPEESCKSLPASKRCEKATSVAEAPSLDSRAREPVGRDKAQLMSESLKTTTRLSPKARASGFPPSKNRRASQIQKKGEWGAALCFVRAHVAMVLSLLVTSLP